MEETTELDFNGRETKGLCPLSYEPQREMYVHPTYAVTAEREPLAVLNAWMEARTTRDTAGQRGGTKENLRWMEGYERIVEVALDMPGASFVYVADRQADLMQLMSRVRAGHAGGGGLCGAR